MKEFIKSAKMIATLIAGIFVVAIMVIAVIAGSLKGCASYQHQDSHEFVKLEGDLEGDPEVGESETKPYSLFIKAHEIGRVSDSDLQAKGVMRVAEDSAIILRGFGADDLESPNVALSLVRFVENRDSEAAQGSAQRAAQERGQGSITRSVPRGAPRNDFLQGSIWLLSAVGFGISDETSPRFTYFRGGQRSKALVVETGDSTVILVSDAVEDYWMIFAAPEPGRAIASELSGDLLQLSDAADSLWRDISGARGPERQLSPETLGAFLGGDRVAIQIVSRRARSLGISIDEFILGMALRHGGHKPSVNPLRLADLIAARGENLEPLLASVERLARSAPESLNSENRMVIMEVRALLERAAEQRE